MPETWSSCLILNSFARLNKSLLSGLSILALKYNSLSSWSIGNIHCAHGFLLAHPRNPELGAPKPLPPPRPDQIEGGSLWYAKAQSMLVVHRNWEDPTDYTTLVKVEKAKPKIVGKKGGSADLTYYAALGIYKDDTFKQPERIEQIENNNDIKPIPF